MAGNALDWLVGPAKPLPLDIFGGGGALPLGNLGGSGGPLPLSVPQSFGPLPLTYVAPGQKKREAEEKKENAKQTAARAVSGQGRPAAAQGRVAAPTGDVANISLSGLGPSQRPEFLRRAMQLGQQLESETGIPAEVFAAMAANESNFGNAPGNIMGGVKATPGAPGAVELDTWEMVNGQRVPMRQWFQASGSPLEGMRLVANTLQSGRYAPAYQALSGGQIDRDEFLRRVNAAGYATNPAWAQNEVIPLMREAQQYRAAPAPPPAAAPAVAPGGSVFPVVGYRGPISAHGGNRGGMDIMAPAGTPVVAMRGGVVTGAGNYPTSGGNYVEIRGDDGNLYYYAHMEQRPTVAPGQPVEAGTPLGTVGNTGNARNTPPHLHLGIGPQIFEGVDRRGGTGGDFDAQTLLRAAYEAALAAAANGAP